MPETQTDLEVFLRRRAQHFSDGNIMKCVESIVTPITITVGLRKLHFADHAAIRAALTQYRENLAVESYEQTLCDILHQSEETERGAQAFLRWTHLNSRGAIIGRTEANYICKRRDEDGAWVVTVIEFLDSPSERFLSGVPIR